MKTDVFNLQILPIDEVLPHEEFDVNRALPLIKELKKEKVLVNPILVASLDNGKYLQLDGMNRLSAFKMMGMKSILTQIIDYNSQDEVELASWVHLFNSDKDKFIKFVKDVPGVYLEHGEADMVGNRYLKEEGTARLCTIVCKEGDVKLVVTSGDLFKKIEKMNKIVSYYSDQITRDVLPRYSRMEQLRLLFSEHPKKNILMVFPTFTRHQIIKVVGQKKLIPAGISRHLFNRRCLNVRVPLSFFDGKKSVEEQNKMLEEFTLNRSYRVYEEPTVYFE